MEQEQPPPRELPRETPKQVVGRIREERALGGEMNPSHILTDVLLLGEMGVEEQSPVLLQWLQEEIGGALPVRTHLLGQLREADTVKNRADVQRYLKIAHLLGYDNQATQPNTARLLSSLADRYKELLPEPSAPPQEAQDQARLAEVRMELEKVQGKDVSEASPEDLPQLSFVELTQLDAKTRAELTPEQLEQIRPIIMLRGIFEGFFNTQQILGVMEILESKYPQINQRGEELTDKILNTYKSPSFDTDVDSLLFRNKPTPDFPEGTIEEHDPFWITLVSLRDTYAIFAKYYPNEVYADLSPEQLTEGWGLLYEEVGKRILELKNPPSPSGWQSLQRILPDFGGKRQQEQQQRSVEITQMEEDRNRWYNLPRLAMITFFNGGESATLIEASKLEDRLISNGMAGMEYHRVVELAKRNLLRKGHLAPLLENNPTFLADLVREFLPLAKVRQIEIDSQIKEFVENLLAENLEDISTAKSPLSSLRGYFTDLVKQGRSVEEVTALIPQIEVAASIYYRTLLAKTFGDQRIPFNEAEQKIHQLEASDDRTKLADVYYFFGLLNDLQESLSSKDYVLADQAPLFILKEDQRITPEEKRQQLEVFKKHAEQGSQAWLESLIDKDPYLLARLLWDGDLTPRQAYNLSEKLSVKASYVDSQAEAISNLVFRLSNEIEISEGQNANLIVEQVTDRETLAKVALYALGKTAYYHSSSPLSIFSIEAVKQALAKPYFPSRIRTESGLELARATLARYEQTAPPEPPAQPETPLSDAEIGQQITLWAQQKGVPLEQAYTAFEAAANSGEPLSLTALDEALEKLKQEGGG